MKGPEGLVDGCGYPGCVNDALTGTFGCRRHPDAVERPIQKIRRLEQLVHLVQEQQNALLNAMLRMQGSFRGIHSDESVAIVSILSDLIRLAAEQRATSVATQRASPGFKGESTPRNDEQTKALLGQKCWWPKGPCDDWISTGVCTCDPKFRL